MSKPELITFLNPQGNFDPHDSYWTEHPDFGGQLVYVKEVCLAMAEEFGVQVDIITRQIKDKDWPEFARKFDSYIGSDKVRIIRLPFGGNEFLNKEQLWPHLNEYVDQVIEFYQTEGQMPAITTTHYGDGGLAGAILQEKTGIPFTFTGHSLGAQKMDKFDINKDTIKELNNRFDFHRRIVAERISMHNSATNFVSTTQERMEQYSHQAYQGVVDVKDDNKFAVVPPGANTNIFNPDTPNKAEEKIKKKIKRVFKRDLDADRRELPAILAASRLDHKKNHVGLVKAFAQNEKLQKKGNLVITLRGIDNPFEDYSQAGGDEEEILDQIMEIISNTDLAGKVSMFSLASQKELAACYRRLVDYKSVFVLTAHYEPFGLAPVEAMASGLPTVATQNGGPSEIMQDNQYGILVDPADPSDIAQGLLKVVGNNKNWKKYRKAGMKRVKAQYTWASTAEGYLNRITKILDNPTDYLSQDKIEIPKYFLTGNEDDDISLAKLKELYLG
ncbi:glycosyltransferase [Halobacteroides halobius DSM 5150]|uniref:sucrose-phosphate synthase n=1 Tax=Halobacteroides halobius (strain ATCC 35273 / DSM 5150 / MD-1) TaxID=748449 RepID=L0KBI7_HALHC|nr:glycosyltransferase [Halobacteroides halobius]AGB41739.1 glycosyltransferase [Halobacteroides halobius DSM 5150]